MFSAPACQVVTVKQLARLVLTGVLLAAAVPAGAGEVKMSFSNGRVTIVASDVSPRQILSEWARLGQVRITNLDRLGGAPVTLQMLEVPEAQALETLLRGTAGYIAAPRPAGASGAVGSRYDRILLMPGAAPAATSAGASAPQNQNPLAGRGRPSPPPFLPDDDNRFDQTRMMPGARQGGGAQGQVIMPGQSVSPGQLAPGQYSPQHNAYQPSPGSAPSIPTYSTPQAPGATGTAVPGMPTTPPLSSNVYRYPQPGSAAGAQQSDEPTTPGRPTPSKPGNPPGAGVVPGSATPGAATPGMPTTPAGPIKKRPGVKG